MKAKMTNRGQESGQADIVFRNGVVYTVDTEKPWASAVAIAGDRILFVGDDAGGQAFVGERTRVVDLRGKLMLPGFVESHWHLSTTSLTYQALLNEREPEKLLAEIRACVAAHPNERAIVGAGWLEPVLPKELIRKEVLDEICPDRPIVLLSTDLHAMWANSKALEVAEITRDTPPAIEGSSWVDKDPVTGEPTGKIYDGAAYSVVFDALERKGYTATDAGLYVKSISAWLPRLTAAGITTIFDAGYLGGAEQSVLFDALRLLEDAGDLPIRVVGSYAVFGPSDDPIPVVSRYRDHYSSSLVRVQTLKLFADGTEIPRTALLLEPYADCHETCGHSVIPASDLRRMILAADAQNIDVMVHCVGDAAVRQTLDILEEVNATNPARDRRHVITHAFLTHPDDIPRFRKLGVLANTQLQWGVVDDYTKVIRERYGDERWAAMYKFRSFVDQGVTVSLGMDALACQCRMQHRPVEHIESGYTRRTVGDPDAMAMPESNQSLSIPQLIAGYTINGAYQLRMEHEIGSIRAGKKADLIVLEHNLFDVRPNEINGIKMDLTIMGGRVTHSSGLFEV